MATMADDSSFSILSTVPDIETLYTPSHTDQQTDGYDRGLETDEYFDQESRLADCDSVCSTSVAPSVYRHEHDHGRRYHSYKSGRYPLPNDLPEQQLEELKHHMLLELTEGHLFLSDIGDHPQKIIDIGTGAGTWAIDVADNYPGAIVVGTDLSPIQPRWLPTNCRMFVDDCEEDEWLHGTGFDLVHLRELSGVLRDLDALLAGIYKNLETGGWVEFQDFIPETLCDDGSMDDDDPLRRFMSLAVKGMRKLGCHQFGTRDIKESLEKANFTNINIHTRKLPIGGWARDERLLSVGAMMKAVVLESLSAFAAKPFEALGILDEERQQLIAEVKKSLEDKGIHRYLVFRFCYGQKSPELRSDFESDI